MMIELILGGARSGKSALAEQRARASGLAVTCIVTAEPRDAEMKKRIAHHQQQRNADWQLREAPIQLTAVLQQEARVDRCLVVDCLTLWLTNLLCSQHDGSAGQGEAPVDISLFQAEAARLLDVLPQLPGHIIFVSNEVGLGIVPMGALSRAFVDEQGRLNQRMAHLADRVTLVTAGLPLGLKG